MDQHLNAVWQMKIERLMKNLEKNQMKGTFLKALYEVYVENGILS